MSNSELIREKIRKGEEIYMVDDFYDVAIRLTGSTKAHLKHKGFKEVSVPYSYDLVCQIELGGKFISREEYENY